MSRYHSYINSAKQVLGQYTGTEPFASFVKKFFSDNKKYGSKDRKSISHLCYSFFRTGKMKFDTSIDDQILAGLFLCSNESNELLGALKPGWNDLVGISMEDKARAIEETLSLAEVFPWEDELSTGIDHAQFCQSFFVQPDLFIRIRPGHHQLVKAKLEKENISFRDISQNCIALANASKIESVLDLNNEAVVQDQSSQNTKELMSLAGLRKSGKVWDCCAASGGKSIMLYDYYPDIDLFVSDNRASIISNLKKRFASAGIKDYKAVVADLTIPEESAFNAEFDLIIADVPCTGSGTWSRTPEQLYYFKKEKIDEYSLLQKKIVSNVIPHLKPGGYLLYITCSVFKKENEEMVEFINQKFQLQLIRMELFKGYDRKADTMFAALLQKSF